MFLLAKSPIFFYQEGINLNNCFSWLFVLIVFDLPGNRFNLVHLTSRYDYDARAKPSSELEKNTFDVLFCFPRLNTNDSSHPMTELETPHSLCKIDDRFGASFFLVQPAEIAQISPNRMECCPILSFLAIHDNYQGKNSYSGTKPCGVCLRWFVCFTYSRAVFACEHCQGQRLR